MVHQVGKMKGYQMVTAQDFYIFYNSARIPLEQISYLGPTDTSLPTPILTTASRQRTVAFIPGSKRREGGQ